MTTSVARVDLIYPFVLSLTADHPAVIFQVVGQSRDDVPTVVPRREAIIPARSQPTTTLNTAVELLAIADRMTHTVSALYALSWLPPKSCMQLESS